MVEEKIDIALVSDYYKADAFSAAWIANAGSSRAAIYIPNNAVTVGNVQRDPEFVSARLIGVQVYCCYASPNRPLEKFCDMLHRLEDSIRSIQRGVPVVVAGDFNSRSAIWGDWVDNRRGEELGLLIESLGLAVMNVGSTPTFARGAGSIVDVTVASDSLASRVVNWRVLESVFNFSDHHYIRFSLMPNPAGIAASCPQVPSGWDTSGGIDIDALLTGLLLAEWLDGGTPLDEQDADTGAVSFRSRVTAACNFALRPRRAPKPGKPPVHWWTAEIASLRSECVRAKRRKVRMVTRITRLRQRGDAEFDNERANAELTRTNDAFREAKKQLKSAILKSKKACWTELITSVDSDPFGKPYKLVMRKLRGPLWGPPPQ